jgi:hypothetical protein
MTTDMQANLIQEQIAALNEYRDLLTRCQSENETLIHGMMFYADRETWRSRLAHLDAGEKAREILKEVTGL